MRGEIVTGHKRQDADLYNELQPVRALIQAWGWPQDTTIQRPEGGATYDFDCIHPITGEIVAVELKEVVSPNTLRDADQNKTTTCWFEIRWPKAPGWERIIRDQMTQADKQLSAASGKRRVVLLRLHCTPRADAKESEDRLWNDMSCALKRIDVHEYPNVDDVWLTKREQLVFWPLQDSSA